MQELITDICYLVWILINIFTTILTLIPFLRLPLGNLELDPFDLVGVLLPLLPLPLLGLLLVHHLLLLGVHQLKPLGSDNEVNLATNKYLLSKQTFVCLWKGSEDNRGKLLLFSSYPRYVSNIVFKLPEECVQHQWVSLWVCFSCQRSRHPVKEPPVSETRMLRMEL